ncbi:major facilitator superfamily domain-containing protein [Podospora australis]|uniref:Major facilitator superfamily domain-containing protein n=1 Tax=Podospora australis TaxID=1536484 RepID=A0AAN6WM89_9PEZI|nr:major facilitator superfamily domain-containing protein [Podospora australis]
MTTDFHHSFMTAAAFQLVYGKLYINFPIKNVYLTSVLIFELNSLLCGSACINAGFIIILAASVPLEKRPIYVSSYSCVYALAALIAPLLGGVFTVSKATWRLCFYINLPIGALAVIAMILFFRPPGKSPTPQRKIARELIREMDVYSTTLLILGVVDLFIALQLGDTRLPWSHYAVLIPLISGIFVLTLALFWGFWNEKRGFIPRRIALQRSLPIWFQAIQGQTPVESGTYILPTTLNNVLFSVLSGVGVAKFGYYTPFMIIGGALLLAGSILATQWSVASPAAQWVGVQIVISMGSGLGLQQAHTAAQTVLSSEDIPTGAVLLIFVHIMDGAIWLPVAQDVLASRLVRGLTEKVPGIDTKAILNGGATSVRGMLSGEGLVKAIEVYNGALTRAFFVAVGLAAGAFISSWGMEWKLRSSFTLTKLGSRKVDYLPFNMTPPTLRRRETFPPGHSSDMAGDIPESSSPATPATTADDLGKRPTDGEDVPELLSEKEIIEKILTRGPISNERLEELAAASIEFKRQAMERKRQEQWIHPEVAFVAGIAIVLFFYGILNIMRL